MVQGDRGRVTNGVQRGARTASLRSSTRLVREEPYKTSVGSKMTSEKDVIVCAENHVDMKTTINENQRNRNITSIKTPVGSSERGAGWTSMSKGFRLISISPPPLLYYGGVGRGATPSMTSTAVDVAGSKIKDSTVSGRSSRNSVVAMDEEELRNKLIYLEYKECPTRRKT